MDTSRVFVVADLTAGDSTHSQNLTHLAPAKEIHLKPATLKVEAAGGEDGNYNIRISSAVLAKSVYLSFGHLDVSVSDNYFNLLPGETVEIHAKRTATLYNSNHR